MSARLLAEAGCRVVAVSDISGALYDPRGLDWHYLESLTRAGGSLTAGETVHEHLTNEQLLQLPVDLLVPAALENQITARNAGRIRARLVVEAANGPVTPAADRILAENGVFLVPDVLANSGGVIVSYFEWVQDLQSFFWEEDEINTRLHRIMTRSFKEVLQVATAQNLSMRDSAYTIAIERVADAVRTRGIFP